MTVTDQIKKSSSLASIVIHDLPTSLILEILLKLPVKSVVSCKLVCKTWYELISTPFFASSYLANPPFATVMLSKTGGDLSLLEIRKYGAEDDDDLICTPFNLEQNQFPDIGVLEMEGSCNGLICLVNSPEHNFKVTNYRFRNQVVYVVNPLSGKYARLPQLIRSGLCKICDVCYGFGSSVSVDCYKVVRIVRGYDKYKEKVDFEILTVWKDSSWRYVQDSLMPKFIYSCGIFVNGFVNWIGQDGNWCFIYAFDIGEERGQRLRLPVAVEARLAREADIDEYELTLRDNNVCLIYFMSFLKLDVWTMKKYGVVESWAKDVILNSWIPSDMHFRPLVPITRLRNGVMLMCTWRSGSLIFVDLEKKRSRKFEVHDAKGIIFSYTYVPNFSKHLPS